MGALNWDDLQVKTVDDKAVFGESPSRYSGYIVRVTHKPTGVYADGNGGIRYHAQQHAYHNLINEMASEEQRILVEAISWSNANMEFEGVGERCDNTQDHDVAADILRGLEHLGWKLVKAS